MERFKDKVVLITGSSDGLGRASAIEFAQEGANIAVHCSGVNEDSLKRGREVVASVEQLGRSAKLFAAQFSNLLSRGNSEREIKDMLRGIEEYFGKLDIVIVNAADSTGREPFEKALNPSRVDYNLSINFQNGLCGVIRAALKMLAASSGTVITISSVVIEQPEPEALLYMLSKDLVESFTLRSGYEFYQRGINIKCLRFGLIRTEPLSYSKKNYPFVSQISEKYPDFEVDAKDAAKQLLSYCDPATRWWTHGQTYDLTRGLSGLNIIAELEKM